MRTVPCSGWWQQAGLGRQAMEGLVLKLDGDRFSGAGTDVVAEFTMQGKFRSDGYVEILKQYRNKHFVTYVGHYDGEGTMSGDWDIAGYRGKWSIRMQPLKRPSDFEIQDLF